MSEIATIHFTQEQARTLTGVSAETIRHWRKLVPHLAGKPGKSARFTFTDVIGLAVTRELIATFGVHIINISQGVDALFRSLSDARPTSLEGAVAMVTTTDTSLIPASDIIEWRFAGPALAVPLDQLIGRLRRQMMPVIPAADQATLPFLPRVVRSGT